MGTAFEDYAVEEDGLDLVNLMEALLANLVAVYDSFNFPLPARRYYMTGLPPWDCEQAVISLIQIYLGAPGDPAATPQQCNTVRSAVFSISITRPIPGMIQTKFPTPEAIMDRAKYLGTDAWILMSSITSLNQWDGMGVIATLDASKQQGDYSTVVLQLTIAVP